MEATAFYTRRKDTSEWLICTEQPVPEHSTVLVQRKSKPVQAVRVGKHVTIHDSTAIPERARSGDLYEIEERLSDSETRRFIADQGITDNLQPCDACSKRAELSHHDDTGLALCRDCEVHYETRQEERKPQINGSDSDLVAALRSAVGQQTIDEAEVRKIADSAVQQALESYVVPEPRVVVDVRQQNGELREIRDAHQVLSRVLQQIALGNHVYLSGPAGSGKTHMCSQVADALGRTLQTTGALLTKFEVLGFIDGHGKYHTTPLREAFEHGHVLNIDEGDACQPAALVAINALLANGEYSFPDRTVKRHPDFVAILCANTIGQGADMMYSGRNPLDEASRDRFAYIHMDYDEGLELAIAKAHYEAQGGTDSTVVGKWVEKVQAARRKALDSKMRHIVSPRASQMGARFLAVCEDADAVDQAFEMYILKGAGTDVAAKLS